MKQTWPRLLRARATELFGPSAQVQTQAALSTGEQVDLLVESQWGRFAVAFRPTGTTASIAGAASALASLSTADVCPLIAVPYMTPAARDYCDAEGIGWFDLSGNANFRTDRALVWLDGAPNTFARPGRPKNVFTERRSAIARWFLENPGVPTTQRQLAEATGLDPSQVSRTARSLIELGLLDETPGRRLEAPDLRAMLLGWAERYAFAEDKRVLAHIRSRSGTETVQQLSASLQAQGIAHAFTGLSAAWLYTHHAMFRTASVYVDVDLNDTVLEQLGLRPMERGENVWLIQRPDPGVFSGERVIEGVRCVSAVQAWLDLAAHAERADDAAEALYKHISEAWAQ